MRNLVPLTKILLTFGTAVWAIVLSEPTSLAALCALELLILLVSGELIKNLKALLALVIFAAMLGVISIRRSASVDLPWSMWAMMEKFLMCSVSMGSP